MTEVDKLAKELRAKGERLNFLTNGMTGHYTDWEILAKFVLLREIEARLEELKRDKFYENRNDRIATFEAQKKELV